MKYPFQIILASTSPRRVDLLKQAGLKFDVRAPEADETPKRGESPQNLVRRLSLAKAKSVRSEGKSLLIIAADTIVVSPNGKKILGKPVDSTDAKKMLKTLSGKTHTVLTGYSLLIIDSRGKQKIKIRVVKSRVKMRTLDSASIQRYVATGEPMDKAGSYAAQGIGAALVESLSGSYANVVGLPICQVFEDIQKLTGVRFLEWLNLENR